MADVKVSALTALTGANLANGDQFLVTDVGSPNVSKSITADELAQGSQFSSRFARAAHAVVWLSATTAYVNSGSPTLGRVNSRTPGYLLDPSSNEGISWAWAVPTDWATMAIELWWSNAGAGSGDVVYSVEGTEDGDGDTPTDAAGLSTTNLAVTAPAQDVLKKTVMKASYTLAGDYMGQLRLARIANSASDTLANDSIVVGVMLRRLS